MTGGQGFLSPTELADLLEARASDDETAAQAYELFGRSVFPFEGVFCDEQVNSRAPLADALRREPIEIAPLLSWVPAFCCALHDLNSPLAENVARALEALLTQSPELQAEPAQLADSPPDLSNLSTSLGDLVDWLCSPTRCGLFLSSPILEQISRSYGVPRGFGPRRRLALNLLQSAAHYGKVDEVLDALSELFISHHSRLSQPPWMDGSPGLATEPWRARLQESSALLKEIQAMWSRQESSMKLDNERDVHEART